jgi:hypothetical protein
MGTTITPLRKGRMEMTKSKLKKIIQEAICEFGACDAEIRLLYKCLKPRSLLDVITKRVWDNMRNE